MKTLSIHTNLDELPRIVPKLRTWRKLAINDALHGVKETDIPPMSWKRESMELWWRGKDTFASDWEDRYTLADALRDILWWDQHQDREFMLESVGGHFFNELVSCENSHDPDVGLNRYRACRLVHAFWQWSFPFLEKTRRLFFRCTGVLCPSCQGEDNRWMFLLTDKDTLPTEAYKKEHWCLVDQEYLNKGGA